jgi:hypothetical protein
LAAMAGQQQQPWQQPQHTWAPTAPHRFPTFESRGSPEVLGARQVPAAGVNPVAGWSPVTSQTAQELHPRGFNLGPGAGDWGSDWDARGRVWPGLGGFGAPWGEQRAAGGAAGMNMAVMQGYPVQAPWESGMGASPARDMPW